MNNKSVRTMDFGKIFVLKHRTMRLSFVLYFILIANSMYSQISGAKYENKNCEYIHFLNSTLVDFMLIGDHIGTKYRGIGVYKIENEHLTITIGNFKYEAVLFQEMNTDSICSDYKVKIDGIDKYKIEMMYGNVIILTGPILEDSEKSNKKNFLQSLKNWPWKWRFKNEQQWYAPWMRELIRK